MITILFTCNFIHLFTIKMNSLLPAHPQPFLSSPFPFFWLDVFKSLYRPWCLCIMRGWESVFKYFFVSLRPWPSELFPLVSSMRSLVYAFSWRCDVIQSPIRKVESPAVPNMYGRGSDFWIGDQILISLFLFASTERTGAPPTLADWKRSATLGPTISWLSSPALHCTRVSN